MVAAGVDPVVVLEAAQSLAPRQALALLRYLAAWLRLHDQVPPGLACLRLLCLPIVGFPPESASSALGVSLSTAPCHKGALVLSCLCLWLH